MIKFLFGWLIGVICGGYFGFVYGIFYTVQSQESTFSKLIQTIAKAKGIAEVLSK